MSNLRWATIHVSLAFMGLSVIAAGMAEPSTAGLRGSDRGAKETMSTSCLEDDFVTATESTGPEREASRGGLARAARSGQVANTAAIVRLADDGARERALDVLKETMKRQETSLGFVGAELGTSRKCGTVRLLSVWRDEPSMLGAATSSAFLTAMDQAASGGGTSAMTAWELTTSELPVDWQAARDKLAHASPLY